MDFYQIRTRPTKRGGIDIYPEFLVKRSKDLMVRGKAFYAIWDEEEQMWSTDEYDVQRLIDRDLLEKKKEVEAQADPEASISVKTLGSYSSKSWAEFKSYIGNISDNSHQLDERLTFQNTKTTKKDYVSKRLPYTLEDGDISAYEELISTLYDPDEREKIEWAIGAVVSGESRDIQKFLVFYGDPGGGKSTVLNLIEKLFAGYFVTFDAKALTSSSNAFATEVFRSNPLVAIQQDGDLSRIEDNSKLNSIVSHDNMVMNEKYKASYMSRSNCFLFMATNKPVKITDARSGIIRRLIDVKPSGRRLPGRKYHSLVAQIDFELGAIAKHCLDIYSALGKNYYEAYRPLDMIYKTDVFFNFVEDSYDIFRGQPGISLKQAYSMYKEYCEDSGAEFKMPMYKVREELKNYFEEFHDVYRSESKQVRSYYIGFRHDKFARPEKPDKAAETPISLVMEETASLFDREFADCFAQYAKADGTPERSWDNVTTRLKDIDTTKLHYVLMPENVVVVDFDKKDKDGKKCARLNLEAASKWPVTYSEYSKSGEGIHLTYYYTGDISELSHLYETDVEVKTFPGKSSLRRKVSRCNSVPIATISSGLPKKEKKMIDKKVIADDIHLRNVVEKALRKDCDTPYTKPCIDLIFKVLEDAYESGITYDLTDLRQKVYIFASKSSNNSEYCRKKVMDMRFASKDIEASKMADFSPMYADNRLIFYDVEVFPNLFLVNWKYENEPEVFREVNPTPERIAWLMERKLIGFNCRKYDNHIMYGRYLGFTNLQLYELSQRIIAKKDRDAFFRDAYNLSYTDILDFSSTKQSLKKFEIELGIHHKELGIPWDIPVPEERWDEVAEYCDYDVLATEAVFHARKADWTGRKILAAITGMTPNDTTNTLTTRLIFGKERNPQSSFHYRNLGLVTPDAKPLDMPGLAYPEYALFDNGKPVFPGYSFENGKSTYRGYTVGEGGRVYAEKGIYYDVWDGDVASMHPHSLTAERLLGPYTDNFEELMEARIAIKHKDFEKARKMFGGKLAPFLDDESSAKDLAQALKIAINSVYGLTSAKFDNPFRDPRNIDNIVAKRGALFMINLQMEVQAHGYTVAHVKTDSIKIPNADQAIIDFVMEYGKHYGYTFETEAVFDRMCLVNDAVYIAKLKDGGWTATGAQFQQPVVFKTLFSHEPIEFSDMCEAKAVETALYLDFDEGLPKDEHNYQFIGKVGLFTPVISGHGGGKLLRESAGKYTSAVGAKDYRWMESETVRERGLEDIVDTSYYNKFIDDAVKAIKEYGDYEAFVAD